jgi:hypothetical protein
LCAILRRLIQRLKYVCSLHISEFREATSKFSLERKKMISNATKRSILRWIHLVVSIPILGYIYSPFEEIPQYASVTRFVFAPIMILAGFWMYAGAIFAIIAVAVWLAAYQLFGIGTAILSLVALIIARKIWLMICARYSKRSGVSPLRP